MTHTPFLNLLHRLPVVNAQKVIVAGSNIFLAYGGTDQPSGKNNAKKSANYKLACIDISSSPLKEQPIEVFENPITDLICSEDILFAAEENTGVHIFQVNNSDLTHLRFISVNLHTKCKFARIAHQIFINFATEEKPWATKGIMLIDSSIPVNEIEPVKSELPIERSLDPIAAVDSKLLLPAFRQGLCQVEVSSGQFSEMVKILNDESYQASNVFVGQKVIYVWGAKKDDKGFTPSYFHILDRNNLHKIMHEAPTYIDRIDRIEEVNGRGLIFSDNICATVDIDNGVVGQFALYEKDDGAYVEGACDFLQDEEGPYLSVNQPPDSENFEKITSWCINDGKIYLTSGDYLMVFETTNNNAIF